MSDGLSIPQDVLERAAAWAIQQGLEATLDLKTFKFLDGKAVAKILGVTTRVLKSLPVDHFDFGERNARWSLKEVEALIEKRRVKASRS